MQDVRQDVITKSLQTDERFPAPQSLIPIVKYYHRSHQNSLRFDVEFTSTHLERSAASLAGVPVKIKSHIARLQIRRVRRHDVHIN